MEALTAVFLVATGFLGGIITAVVGGSSIICFPAMLAVGLPPIVASASNTVAVAPASLIAAYSDTGRAPTWSTEVLGFALASASREARLEQRCSSRSPPPCSSRSSPS
jgi:uncharacterized protein